MNTELAWAAGFFEGEGSVSWTKPYMFKKEKGMARRYIRLSVHQHHDPYTLHRFHAAVAELDPYLSKECVKRIKYNTMMESGECDKFPEFT